MNAAQAVAPPLDAADFAPGDWPYVADLLGSVIALPTAVPPPESGVVTKTQAVPVVVSAAPRAVVAFRARAHAWLTRPLRGRWAPQAPFDRLVMAFRVAEPAPITPKSVPRKGDELSRELRRLTACSICRHPDADGSPCSECSAKGYQVSSRAKTPPWFKYVYSPPGPDLEVEEPRKLLEECKDYGARKPWHPSGMEDFKVRVTVVDVLGALVGSAGPVESTTGAQLDILRNRVVRRARTRRKPASGAGEEAVGGVSPPRLKITRDPWSGVAAAEHRIIGAMGVSRMIARLTSVQATTLPTPALSALAKRTGRGLGELVITCLRAYEERGADPHRAFAEVVVWAQRVFGVEPVDVVALAEAFKNGKEKDERKRAARYHDEALAILRGCVAAPRAPKRAPVAWVKAPTAAKKSGLSERTLRDWCVKGKIGAKQIDGIWMIDLNELMAQNPDRRQSDAAIVSEGHGALEVRKQ